MRKNGTRLESGAADLLGAKMTSGPFTLAQLARLVRMSVVHVRFYRECGLLQPPRRQRGRSDHFAFQAEHVERLRFIQHALVHGFLVEDIAKMVHHATTCSDVQRIAVHRLAELRRNGAADATIVALEKLTGLCPGVGSRKDCKILDALVNGRGQLPDRECSQPVSRLPA